MLQLWQWICLCFGWPGDVGGYGCGTTVTSWRRTLELVWKARNCIVVTSQMEASVLCVTNFFCYLKKATLNTPLCVDLHINKWRLDTNQWMMDAREWMNEWQTDGTNILLLLLYHYSGWLHYNKTFCFILASNKKFRKKVVQQVHIVFVSMSAPVYVRPAIECYLMRRGYIRIECSQIFVANYVFKIE